jgi:hypothetical protein
MISVNSVLLNNDLFLGRDICGVGFEEKRIQLDRGGTKKVRGKRSSTGGS